MFAGQKCAANELVMRLQPDEAVYMKTNVKSPGLKTKPLTSELDLTYGDRYGDENMFDAYTRLILEVIRGRQATFVRDDELRAAWKSECSRTASLHGRIFLRIFLTSISCSFERQSLLLSSTKSNEKESSQPHTSLGAVGLLNRISLSRDAATTSTMKANTRTVNKQVSRVMSQSQTRKAREISGARRMAKTTKSSWARSRAKSS
jgi:hypothetical protein